MATPNQHGGTRAGSGRKPGSKPLANRELREAAKKFTTQALNTLAAIMADEDSPAPSRVAAANAVLDRGIGKVANYLDLDFDIGELEPATALEKIGGAVSTGKISPQEGQQLVGIVEARIKAVELSELESRLAVLEAK